MACITKIVKERHEEPVPVYNFHVKEWASYFVGEVRAYVHNGKERHITSKHKKKYKPENEKELLSRKQAMREAKDRAGIPRSQQPDRQWQVGGDISKKWHEPKNYKYDDNPGSHGRYYEYDTPNGKRVVAEHTNKAQGGHFHAGEPKEDDILKSHTYDFKKERYLNIKVPNKDKHIYYK